MHGCLLAVALVADVGSLLSGIAWPHAAIGAACRHADFAVARMHAAPRADVRTAPAPIAFELAYEVP